ncbi:uncharacterized protein [Arachis hypogaea]|uniref:uncharacterized protein n=2 Tax=Arachis TaxID=3817 RepID=UPI0007AEEF7B|nr:uncharacterized protein LOC112750382 isoform X2 [Arachis hypogaea]
MPLPSEEAAATVCTEKRSVARIKGRRRCPAAASGFWNRRKHHCRCCLLGSRSLMLSWKNAQKYFCFRLAIIIAIIDDIAATESHWHHCCGCCHELGNKGNCYVRSCDYDIE